jgi:uncharacterized Zn finger protein (UPF0148 family)
MMDIDYTLLGYHCPTCHDTPKFFGNSRDGVSVCCCENSTETYRGGMAHRQAVKEWRKKYESPAAGVSRKPSDG